MKRFALAFFLLSGPVSPAEEEWANVAYFQRRDAKMRIAVYDPPIVMEWLKIPNNIPEEVKGKLEAIAAKSYLMHDSFESWKQYTTKEYRDVGDDTPEKFEQQNIDFEEAKRLHPKARFQSFLYSVDFLVKGETYSMVVEAIGEHPLTYFPDDMEAFKQSEWHGMAAAHLKFEDGIWKNHYVPSGQIFPPMWEFNDFGRLRAVMETGYAYHSIDHTGIWPFDPPDALRNDSVRDRRPGETVFRYPVKKPNVPPPDVPSAVESADPHSEEEEAKSAPGGSAPPSPDISPRR